MRTALPERVRNPWTRRGFFYAGGALCTAAVLPFGGQRLLAASAVHSFNLGSAEITVASDGVFSLPVSLVLPATPASSIETLLRKPGVGASVVLQTNVTIVRDGPVLALIDTGAGPDFMPTLGRLPDALDTLGFSPDDVTHVIFTHAHADHFWGVFDPLGDGTRWPKARHIMPALERDFWLAPGAPERVPSFQRGMAAGIARRLRDLGDRLTTARPETELAKGISYLATAGHTPGHCSVVVRSGGVELIVVGDALTHATVSFAAPDWPWGSDVDPTLAVASRRRLLAHLARSQTPIIGYHLPWPGVGRAERDGSAYRFKAT